MSLNNQNDQKLEAPILTGRPQSLRQVQPVDISQNTQTQATEVAKEEKQEDTVAKVSEEDLAPVDTTKKDELSQIESEIDPEDAETSEEEKRKERLEILRLESTRKATINLGKPDDIVKALSKMIKESSNLSDEDIEKIRKDPNSEFNKLVDAYQRDDHEDANAKRHINKDLKDSLRYSKKLTTEDEFNSKEVNLSKQFKDGESISLDGKRGLAVFTALSGAVKKVYLPNSGISVTLRTIPLDVLSNFYNAVAHESWEYGREFGEFYYTYSHLRIVKSLVDIILPVAVFGSNYVNWKSKNSLLKAISYHDLNTLAWAISTMLYPQGTEINFCCPECGGTVKEACDLTKLKITDSALISTEAAELLRNSRTVTDDDLVKYQDALNFEKQISNVVKTPLGERSWTVTLKQANLEDYSALGDEFLENLTANSSATDSNRVTEYMFYSKLKQYKPWIKDIHCSIHENGQTNEFSIKLNGEEFDNQTLDTVLAGFRTTWPDFDTEIDKYILSTRITHTAFYMPKCPKCGAETDSVHGFIPFDAISYFFTLCYQKLVTDRYQTELKRG